MNTTFSPVIGRVKGPGQIPHTFSVVAFATEKPTKIGEFVLCDVSVDGVSQTILARVIEHHPLRLFPDSFLANPGLAPKEISAAVGYAGNIDHQMEFVAEIIGYYDQRLEDFINPRIQPTTGTEVKLACDAQLTQLLSRLQPHQVGAAVVGSVLSRETDRVPIALDVAAIVNT